MFVASVAISALDGSSERASLISPKSQAFHQALMKHGKYKDSFHPKGRLQRTWRQVFQDSLDVEAQIEKCSVLAPEFKEFEGLRTMLGSLGMGRPRSGSVLSADGRRMGEIHAKKDLPECGLPDTVKSEAFLRLSSCSGLLAPLCARISQAALLSRLLDEALPGGLARPTPHLRLVGRAERRDTPTAHEARAVGELRDGAPIRAPGTGLALRCGLEGGTNGAQRPAGFRSW
jgi:hypothetical protein